jgi:hypothetical protein
MGAYLIMLSVRETIIRNLLDFLGWDTELYVYVFPS